LFCVHAETTGGQITIGNSTAPIDNNPDTASVRLSPRHNAKQFTEKTGHRHFKK
jgi:hypothetical protein